MNMRKSRVLRQMREGKVATCIKQNLADPRITEIAAMCGFDCVWIDLEHVPNNMSCVEDTVRAAKIYDVDVLTRVSKGCYSDICRPLEGEIVESHSLTVPVVSETLGEWRVHTGIDISAEEGAEVFCSADGEISRIYHDPMHGMTVEVSHEGDIVTIYANLDEMVANGLTVGQKIKKGDKIGYVGDTSLVELGKEPHLHFVIRLRGVAVNPLDYFEEETK